MFTFGAHGFNVTTGDTAPVIGHYPISYMSLNLNIRHKEPHVHNWNSFIRLFALDLYVILWYFRPLQDANFAINLTQANKFIDFPHINILQCDKITAKNCWSPKSSFSRRSKSNPIELNFNRTQSNSIELNRWIEFDWVRQSNEIELTEK